MAASTFGGSRRCSWSNQLHGGLVEDCGWRRREHRRSLFRLRHDRLGGCGLGQRGHLRGGKRVLGHRGGGPNHQCADPVHRPDGDEYPPCLVALAFRRLEPPAELQPAHHQLGGAPRDRERQRHQQVHPHRPVRQQPVLPPWHALELPARHATFHISNLTQKQQESNSNVWSLK